MWAFFLLGALGDCIFCSTVQLALIINAYTYTIKYTNIEERLKKKKICCLVVLLNFLFRKAMPMVYVYFTFEDLQTNFFFFVCLFVCLLIKSSYLQNFRQNLSFNHLLIIICGITCFSLFLSFESIYWIYTRNHLYNHLVKGKTMMKQCLIKVHWLALFFMNNNNNKFIVFKQS